MRILHRLLCIVSLISCAVALTAATAVAQEKQEPRFRALVLAEHDGHGPFVDAALEWLKPFAEEHNFEYDVFEHPKGFNKEFLSKYQVFIQLNHPPYRFTDEEKAAFEDYIEQGRGGWVGMHHATLLGDFDNFEIWDWFSQFMGGIKFKNYIAKRVSGTVHVEAADHPAFQGVAPDFVIDEEEWYTFDKNPRPNVHVLANVDEASYTPEANVNNVTMGDHPVVWSNEKMKARNIYFLMGHHPSLMKNENFVKLLGNSILWCAEKNQK